MSDIADYEAKRVSTFGQKDSFDLSAMIRNYIIFTQCTSMKDIKRYVYNEIGKQYESDDFDGKIEGIVKRFIVTGLFTREANMIYWKPPKKTKPKKPITKAKRKKVKK